MTKEKIKEYFSNLALEDSLIREIAEVGRFKKTEAGQMLVSQGAESREVPIVLSGSLRVTRNDENGNEMFLYYLEGGDTCAMSITCCMEGKKANFSAVSEEKSEIWMIPMHFLEEWMSKYESFRRYILSSYQLRFDELLGAIDSIAFMKMDQRLYKYLLDKKQATGSYVINKTHEQIATELNTSRVVVSRLLKQLERDGKIEQYRNRIEVL